MTVTCAFMSGAGRQTDTPNLRRLLMESNHLAFNKAITPGLSERLDPGAAHRVTYSAKHRQGELELVRVELEIKLAGSEEPLREMMDVSVEDFQSFELLGG